MNATAGRVAPRALDGGGDQLVEPQRLVRLAVGLAVARQLDQVADQLAELLDLGDEVGPQALAIGLGQRARPAQHLEVGAQRGERRAQLVRGVGHEPALGALRVVERLEHRVERRGQPRQLVLALRLDAAREVARAGHVLGRLGQLGHRPDGVARGVAGEEGGERDDGDRAERRGRGGGSRARRRPRSAAARAAPPGSGPGPLRSGRARACRRPPRRRRTRARRPSATACTSSGSPSRRCSPAERDQAVALDELAEDDGVARAARSAAAAPGGSAGGEALAGRGRRDALAARRRSARAACRARRRRRRPTRARRRRRPRRRR